MDKIGTRLHEHKEDCGRSVFRDHPAMPLKNRAELQGLWKSTHRHETCVSTYIEKMPFLWLKVDEWIPESSIERNAISLLSNWKSKANRRSVDRMAWTSWLPRKPERPQLNHRKKARIRVCGMCISSPARKFTANSSSHLETASKQHKSSRTETDKSQCL